VAKFNNSAKVNCFASLASFLSHRPRFADVTFIPGANAFCGMWPFEKPKFPHSASKAFFALGQVSISFLDNLRAIQQG
jgi:hypothetical protein